MNLIVAVDKNWGIGKDNDLLISIPEDMQFFKEKTMGKRQMMRVSFLCENLWDVAEAIKAMADNDLYDVCEDLQVIPVVIEDKSVTDDDGEREGETADTNGSDSWKFNYSGQNLGTTADYRNWGTTVSPYTTI